MGYSALFRFYSKVDLQLVNQYIWPIVNHGFLVLIETYKSRSNLVESIIERDMKRSSLVVFFISNNFDIYESSFFEEISLAYMKEKEVILVLFNNKEDFSNLISHREVTDIIHFGSNEFPLVFKRLRLHIKRHAGVIKSPDLKTNDTFSLDHLFTIGKYHTAIGDYKQAFDHYQYGADKGYAPAQCELAHLFMYGRGCIRSIIEAEKWLIYAAELGDTSAQFELGCNYIVGNGFKKDYIEALRWLHSAAYLGNSVAQEFLGKIYYQGEICEQNYNHAVYWFICSALQGRNNAQYELGNCYFFGRGVSKNYSNALKWYSKAAQNENLDAQFMVGVCYEEGYGVAVNPTESLKWYRKAARNGHPVAIKTLNQKYNITSLQQ